MIKSGLTLWGAGRAVLAAIGAVALVAVACSRPGPRTAPPAAVKGVIDLRAWDFARDGIVDLSGQWEFHWREFIEPGAERKAGGGPARYIGVPGAWNDMAGFPEYGYATYRLVVLLPRADASLGLGFLDMGTACRVYVDGVQVHSAGSPGMTPAASVPGYSPGTVVFTPGRPEVEIVIHVSNFSHRKAGMWDRIKLGTVRSVTAAREWSLAFEIFLFGCFFIMGMYHLVLFLLRKTDPSPLWFGLYCLCISLFTIATGERFIVRVFPSISWELHFRLIAFSIYASVPVFALFLRSLFPGEFSKVFLRALLGSGAASVFIALIFPASLNSHALVYYQALILASCLYAVFVLVLAQVRRRDGAGVFLVSVVVLFGTAVNDILHDNDIIRTAFFIPAGFLVFIFSHSFILSRRFSRAYTTIEKQSKEISEMRYYLQNIIDSMPSILVGVDTRGMITQWNIRAGDSTGLKKHQAEGKPIGEVFPLLEKHMDRVRAAIRERRPQSTERVIHMEHGEARYSDVMVYPLIANGVEGAVIRIDDVTSRVRIEEMMVQTEKMMSVGGLAAGMAHEINNPLGAMLMAAQNMARRVSPDLEKNAEVAAECGTDIEKIGFYMEKRGLVKMMEEIATMGQRAARIVSNMLTFSRKSGASLQHENIAEIVDRALELAANDYDLKKHFDFRHMNIVRDYGGDVPPVPCVATEIEQVVLNLVKNAAHAMFDAGTEGPRITVRIRNAGDYVHLEVEDNGPGMDAETSRRAFEPFFTTKAAGVGTGLGLSVSYFIVTKNHGGTMMVESSPGAGARFIVNLPAGGGARELFEIPFHEFRGSHYSFVFNSRKMLRVARYQEVRSGGLQHFVKHRVIGIDCRCLKRLRVDADTCFLEKIDHRVDIIAVKVELVPFQDAPVFPDYTVVITESDFLIENEVQNIGGDAARIEQCRDEHVRIQDDLHLPLRWERTSPSISSMERRSVPDAEALFLIERSASPARALLLARRASSRFSSERGVRSAMGLPLLVITSSLSLRRSFQTVAGRVRRSRTVMNFMGFLFIKGALLSYDCQQILLISMGRDM